MANIQTCCYCKQEKPLTAFPKNKSKKSGYGSQCKTCRKEYYKNNKEQELASNRKYVEANKPKVDGYKRDWHFQTKYGLSLEQLDAMKLSQSFRCKICGKHEKETPRQALCVDHCHKTNEVRGLLCESCNQALGLFYDNVDNLRKAIDYLDG
jgi:hypothetical protein